MVKRDSVDSLKLLVPVNHGKSGHGGADELDAGAEQAANVGSAQIRTAEAREIRACGLCGVEPFFFLVEANPFFINQRNEAIRHPANGRAGPGFILVETVIQMRFLEK